MASIENTVGYLRRLRDVLFNSPSDGDVVTYVAADGEWENKPGGGGGGGATAETAQLGTDSVTAAADTSIQFGNGGPNFSVNRWIDGTNALHTSGAPAWLDIADPTTPELAAGTYIIEFQANASSAITTATSIQLTSELNIPGPGLHPVVPSSSTGSVIPVDTTCSSPSFEMSSPAQIGASARLQGVIGVGPGIVGNLGTLNYSATFNITKIA